MPKREVTIIGHSIHGRSAEGLAEYQEVVDVLAGLSPVDSQFTIGGQVVAIATTEVPTDGFVYLRYIAGHPETGALLFDPGTGELDEFDFEHRFIARSAWLVIDPARRLATLEIRRPGVSASTIASHIERVMEDVMNLQAPTFTLNPIPSKSILEELDRLERIREASVVLARPNFDWTENADQLSQMGDESDAGQVEVGARAPRGKSLRLRDGILGAIRSLAENQIGPIRDFRVNGTRTGENKERRISLENNSERRFVSVHPSESESERVRAESARFLSEFEVEEENNNEG